MATLITNNTAGNILIQTGVGIPNHVAPKGSQFTDITTANLYINKDGIINWVLNIDASNSGTTSNIYSFNTFSSTTIGQTFVSTSIANDTIILSGIGLNILTDDTNNILTFSSKTSTDTYVTGGTYSNGTATFTNNTGGTFNVNGFYTGATDVYVTGLTFNPSNYDLTISRNDNVSFTESLAILSSDMVVTGGTYNPSTGIATFTNNSGGTFNVSGFLTGMTDTYVTGLTYSNNLITLKQNGGQPNLSILIDNMSGLTINGALSATTYYNLPTDIRVTGGTYSNGTTIFTNNTGGTFNVTGYYTGATDVYTTGATYNNNTFTHTNNTGGTYNVSFNSVTGLTVNGTLSATTISGDTIYANNFPQLPYIDNQTIDYYVASGDTFIRLKDIVAAPSGGTRTFIGNVVVGSGFSANTISATTYYNLPTDIRVTGGTYSNGTIVFTNNTGGTFNVTGLSTGNTDTFVTGGTYSNGTTTFRNNTGGTFNVTGYYTGATDVYTTGATYSDNTFTHTNNTGGTYNVSFNSVTGLTVNGNLTVTGNTITNTLSATSISGTSFYGDGSNLTNISATATKFTVNCRNQSGSDMYKGMIVYISGSTGNKPTIQLAKANSEMTSARTFGALEVDIANNADGTVVVIGSIQTLDTRTVAPHPFTVDTLNDGDTLYLSPVNAGYVTNIKPYAPNHLVYIGKVIRTTPTNGYIEYQIQNGYELNEIHDVMSTGATFGDILSYSVYNGYNVWTSTKTLNGSYTITGNTTIGGTMQAATVSATTYQNLPTDIRVTGATYNNNTFTYTNNTGGTFNVLFNSVTGLTVNGTLSATTISGATIYANDFPQLPYTDNQTLEIYTSGGYDYLRLKDTVSAPSGGTRTFNGNVAISSGLTSTTISATTYQNLPKIGFSPINVGVCDTAPTAASTQYYYQTIAEVTTTLSKVKLWGYSGSDLVLFGIYRGTLQGSMTLIGQAIKTCGLGPNELTLTAETGQNLSVVAGEDLVVGYYPDGTSWRTVYDVGISDIYFGITNTTNITTMPATPTGTATGIRFACTLY